MSTLGCGSFRTPAPEQSSGFFTSLALKLPFRLQQISAIRIRCVGWRRASSKLEYESGRERLI